LVAREMWRQNRDLHLSVFVTKYNLDNQTKEAILVGSGACDRSVSRQTVNKATAKEDRQCTYNVA